MKEIQFLVQGSAPQPYTVRFVKEEDRLSAYCTCPAGENGQCCKHRLSLLAGDGEAVVSENSYQLEVVTSWLRGTDLEKLLVELTEAEKSYDTAKQRLARAKQHVTQAMRN